jgi:hypothetical protein
MRTIALGLAIVALSASLGSAAYGAGRQQAAPCSDQLGFSNTSLTIVTTVKPAASMTWTFDDAPSVVAKQLLSDLNGNTNGIVFKEADGVIPNLYFYVTLSETNSGTQQDTAYVSVTGLAKPGTLFSETSGPAPFIGWRSAIDHLATNMLVWLHGGWHTNPPCRRPDGSMRTQWPE